MWNKTYHFVRVDKTIEFNQAMCNMTQGFRESFVQLHRQKVAEEQQVCVIDLVVM